MRRRQIARLLALAAAALAIWAGLAAHQWRSAKLALLEPTTDQLSARPDPGSDTGGLLLFGDSRVAHWSPLPERPFPITRHGHVGESAIRLQQSFEAALARHQPRLVILQLGANDAVAASLASPAVRTEALAATKAAIGTMAAAAEARGVPLLILETLPPIRPDPLRRLVWRGHVEPFITELNAAIPSIAAAHGASSTDPLPLLGGSPETVPDAYRRDSVHLTPAAYARLNQLIPDTL